MATKQDKIKNAISQIIADADPASYEAMMEEIIRSSTERMRASLTKADCHVMLGLSHMNVFHADRVQGSSLAVVMDTETTGLDPKTDEVIQLSMLKVRFDKGGIVEITEEFFDQFQEPAKPISAEITSLTGITNEQVAGQKIDQEAAAKFIEDADVIIAHNASFDRKFVEARLPDIGFADKNWACSLKDVRWKARTTSSPKLELLVHSQGYVYPAHNAYADCKATAFVLSRKFDGDVEPMAEIYDVMKRDKVMVMATGLPFGRQEPLKAAGFKWSPDRSGEAGDKCWHLTVSTAEEAQEAAKAVKEAFGGDVIVPIRKITPKNAYSDRLSPVIPKGFETKNPLKALNMHDMNVDEEHPDFGF